MGVEVDQVVGDEDRLPDSQGGIGRGVASGIDEERVRRPVVALDPPPPIGCAGDGGGEIAVGVEVERLILKA